MNRELLPCPFCGGEARFRVYDLKGYRGKYEYIIRCDNCNIQFKESDVYQNKIKARQKVIDKWNTRKPIDRIVAQLEEEKDIAYADFEKYAYDYFLDLDEDADDWYYKGLERAINVIRKGGVE